MRHDIFQAKGGKLVLVGQANGRHPLEAVRNFRVQSQTGRSQFDGNRYVAKRTSANSSARAGIVTPVQCKHNVRLKPVVTAAPAYYDMRKPEAKEAWADRVASYEADKAHTAHLLGE